MKRTMVIAILALGLLAALLFAHAEAAQTPIDEVVAKSIALAHAALTEDDVTALKVQRDREDGREVFEVEFWKDATEYDYDIDAATGEIAAFDVESRGAALPHLGEAAVSPESALQAALERAGVAGADATVTEAAIKYKNGGAKYKIEFTAGGMEYEVEIDAASGAVLEYDAESEDD